MRRHSLPVAGGLYRLDTLPTAALTPADVAAARNVHAACFPADAVGAGEPDAVWLDRVAVCHDPGACVWLLLWEEQDARPRGPRARRQRPSARSHANPTRRQHGERGSAGWWLGGARRGGQKVLMRSQIFGASRPAGGGRSSAGVGSG